MKIFTLLLFSLVALTYSCQSPKESPIVKKPLNGKWIVETEQVYIEKDDEVKETSDSEQIAADSAYIYNFKSDSLVSLTNLNGDFNWDFKLSSKDSILSLANIHADAEDDQLVYRWENDRLILIRKMEDQDPMDDSSSVTICFLMTLKKLTN